MLFRGAFFWIAIPGSHKQFLLSMESRTTLQIRRERMVGTLRLSN